MYNLRILHVHALSIFLYQWLYEQRNTNSLQYILNRGMEGILKPDLTSSNEKLGRHDMSSSNTRKYKDVNESDNVVEDERPSTSSTEKDMCTHQCQGNGELNRKPRLWEDTYTSLVVLCLFTVSGFLLICLPFLPNTYSGEASDNTSYIIRKVVIVVSSVFGLIAILNLLYTKEKLHDSGLALWPHQCKHCSHLFDLLSFRKNAIGRQDLRYENIDSSEESKDEQNLPVNRASLYVTYIFGMIVIGFVIFNLLSVLVCSMMDESSHVLQSQEAKDIVSITLYDLYLIIAIYFKVFRFIPAFFDAHLVGIPKLRWFAVLITGQSVWLAFSRLARPFALLTSGRDPYLYKFSSNCTLIAIMEGAYAISVPFFVEHSIMIACFMIGLWSRFLPRYMLSLTKRSLEVRRKDHRKGSAGSRSTLLRCFSFHERCKKDNREKQHLLGAKGEPGYESICLQDMAAVEDRESSCSDIHTEKESKKEHSNFCCKTGHVSLSRESLISSFTKPIRSKQPLSRRLEISGAVMILVGGLYFGLSNILMVEYNSDSSDEPGKGRYLQWIATMALFIPELVLIFKQRSITHREDGSFSAKRETCATSGDNDNVFLLIVTGASLYEVACLVASLGNLCKLKLLSSDAIALNAVSVCSSLFGTFRKCTEAVFLMCVHRQHLRNSAQRDWTLLCLLYMGIANATQWFWNSLLHDMTSYVAWPVLVTFFDGKVGEFAGSFLVPFDHLYELHVVIYSWEVFKMIRAAPECQNAN